MRRDLRISAAPPRSRCCWNASAPRSSGRAMRICRRVTPVLAPGELVMGGRRVQVRRPLARPSMGTRSSHRAGPHSPPRIRCPSVQSSRYSSVCRRGATRSLEPLPDELVACGARRSAVRRRFVAATEKQMAEWRGHDLGAIDLVVLMIHGVYIEEHVLLVALGIDTDGKKHVHGVREGDRERASCTALLTDLRERGLHTERAVLAVIDESNARASDPVRPRITRTHLRRLRHGGRKRRRLRCAHPITHHRVHHRTTRCSCVGRLRVRLTGRGRAARV